jgi:hypothetical protein
LTHEEILCPGEFQNYLRSPSIFTERHG